MKLNINPATATLLIKKEVARIEALCLKLSGRLNP